jgi:hypothetical protein
LSRVALPITSAALLLACDPEPEPGTDAGMTEDDTGGTVDDAGTDGGTAPSCVEHEALCQDESIGMLMLQSEPSAALITEEGTTAGEFTTHIDATAGGFGAPPQSYVYGRFTDAGLEVVRIDDETSLESGDWDIAFRRFVMRLNSGVSGPGCVEAGRTAPGSTFDAVTSVPADVEFFAEEYLSGDSCEFIADATGMGPQTVLSSYFAYASCLSMTGNVYIVALGDGRHVKLEVISYYTPSVQDACDSTGTAPMPTGSGNMRIRWAFLD